jgi:glutamate-1-semialdehyde 2,1-aminomutase/spore coat polysaccharide biosynthesis protein SpsF
MRTVAVIQARMGSSRLPGKVLADICGVPMLGHIVRRVQDATAVDDVVVATSASVLDDPIAKYCSHREITCYRGSEEDVLDRYYRAAEQAAAEIVVRITGDCPLIDPEIIDRVVRIAQNSDCDYAANVIRYTYPDGLDVEAFSFAALQRSWVEATKPSQREHVTSFLRHEAGFRRCNVEHTTDFSRRNYRWSVDTAADLEFVRAVYRCFAPGMHFRLRDIVDLLEREPGLAAMQPNQPTNEGYYRSLLNEAPSGAAPKLALQKSQEWLKRAQEVIPGCAQTFSKSFTQYVAGASPVFLQRGKGCRVWDVDGNEYIDYVQGLLPNILGYANEEVNAAHAAQAAEGHSFSLPHPLEVELAERLCAIIPCAEMVRFGKNGSDVTAGAVRVARAFTGRDRIACCGYHGWQDWFIGSTTRNAGVPEAVCQLTHPFPYNDLNALAALLNRYAGEFAAVIMEPLNFTPPQRGYLEGVKELARKHGAVLIFDEICSGFHFGLGGAQKKFGVTPDLACFGKAMGNGYPIACLVGQSEIMRTCEDVFFSFTLGGEVASMAAAMKVLDLLEHTDALARIEAIGGRLQDGLNLFARECGIQARLQCLGYPNWSVIKFRDANGADSLLERSLFQQEAVKRGVLLLVTHNVTAAHDQASIDKTLAAYAAVVKTVAGWLSEPDPSKFLEGAMIQSIFRVR